MRISILCGLAAIACSASLVAAAPVAGPQRYDSCLSLDTNGRAFPNPNAGYICSQIEFLRQDCEALEKSDPVQRGTFLHCVDYSPSDVRAAPAAATTAARQKVGGG